MIAWRRTLKSAGLACTTCSASAQVAGDASAMDRGRTSLGSTTTPRVITLPVPAVVAAAGGGAAATGGAGATAGEGDVKTLPATGVGSGAGAGSRLALGGEAEGLRVAGRRVGDAVTTAPLVTGTAITGARATGVAYTGVAATGVAYGELAGSLGIQVLSLRGRMRGASLHETGMELSNGQDFHGVRFML